MAMQLYSEKTQCDSIGNVYFSLQAILKSGGWTLKKIATSLRMFIALFVFLTQQPGRSMHKSTPLIMITLVVLFYSFVIE